MFELKQIKTQAAQHSYMVFGKGPVDLVMEIGLGATIGEWYHIAEHLADEYSVLLYERSRSTKTARTPENIAKELHLLLDSLGHGKKSFSLPIHRAGCTPSSLPVFTRI